MCGLGSVPWEVTVTGQLRMYHVSTQHCDDPSLVFLFRQTSGKLQKCLLRVDLFLLGRQDLVVIESGLGIRTVRAPVLPFTT